MRLLEIIFETVLDWVRTLLFDASGRRVEDFVRAKLKKLQRQNPKKRRKKRMK